MDTSFMHNRPLLLSLTSYPARIGTASQVICSLLAQTVKPEKIVLWLAREEFPNGENDLPTDLLVKTRGTNFEIDWCENIRSYKKLIPALRKYPDCDIVTLDDDIVYPPDMLEKLLAGQSVHPEAVQAMRVHVITSQKGTIAPYSDWIQESGTCGMDDDYFPTGGAGSLYPPGCLDERVFDMKLAQELCPGQDDIWFWAMARLKGTPVNAILGGIHLDYVNGTQNQSLWSENKDGGNDQALARLFTRFPELGNRLARSHRPLPENQRRLGGLLRATREGRRAFSLRLNIPLFQMKYNEDYSCLTYYLLKIPVFRKHCKKR